MRSFQRFGDNDDAWFRVGEIGVTTTIAVASVSVVYMFIWAFESARRPISRILWLSSDGFFDRTPFESGSVLSGQIWRVFTWWIPIEPTIWTVILVVVFFMLGSQLEARMGRVRFGWFLATLTVVPAILLTIFELAGLDGLVFGLRFVEIGVLVAFAAHVPRAMFFFGIPAWAIAGIIVVIDALQFIDNRDNYSLVMLFTTAGLSLVLIRAMGFAEELEWLPKVPLPARLGGDPYRAANRRRERQPRRATHLSSVPQPSLADQTAQREIDALLDKVAEQGMDSLTRAEKKALEDHSKRLRKRRDS